MEQIGDPLNGKRLVFARPDGTIVVVSPASPIPPGTSEDEYIQWVALDTKRAARFDGQTWPNEAKHAATLHESELKTRFRGKSKVDQSGKIVDRIDSAVRWDDVTKTITLDVHSARNHILFDLRIVRDGLLSSSDSAKARLDEIGTPAQQKVMKEHRQKLRDLPAVIAAEMETMTVEQLENYKPQFPTIGE